MNNIVTIENPKSPIAESYRNIRTNIEFSNIDKDLKTILFTSSQQNEGKTTIVSNLAVTFANLDKKVIIVDCDLRNPSVHKKFKIGNIYGVTDVLLEKKSFNSCVKETDVKNLDIITAGEIPFNPSEILSSKKMKEFINNLKEVYDYVFIDTPPIGIVTDAGILSTYSDGVAMVVGSGEVSIELAKVSVERLNKINANLIGVILNKFNIEGDKNMNDNNFNGDDTKVNPYKATSNLNTALENPQINVNSVTGINVKDLGQNNYASEVQEEKPEFLNNLYNSNQASTENSKIESNSYETMSNQNFSNYSYEPVMAEKKVKQENFLSSILHSREFKVIIFIIFILCIFVMLMPYIYNFFKALELRFT